MKHSFASLAAMIDHGFDTVIDVRSPSEFAADHIPGAINLPALSDAERAQVGTLYKQVSPFDARKLGAALISRNMSTHLRGPLADHTGDWRPLVYCWRGGQRSGSVATILAQIGWRVGLVDGGYQSWRRLVVRDLYDQVWPGRVVVLDGLTGTGKSEILRQLPQHGVQVIDLEGIAHHRGSILGGYAQGQPSQKAFETRLAAVMSQLDPTRPVVIEAESNKVGDLHVPPALWEAMKPAPAISVHAGQEARAAYLARAYQDISADPDALCARLGDLRALRGAETVARWQKALTAGALADLASALMQDHYDPAYRKSQSLHARPGLGVVDAGDLSDAALAQAAMHVAAHVKTMSG